MKSWTNFSVHPESLTIIISSGNIYMTYVYLYIHVHWKILYMVFLKVPLHKMKLFYWGLSSKCICVCLCDLAKALLVIIMYDKSSYYSCVLGQSQITAFCTFLGFIENR